MKHIRTYENYRIKKKRYEIIKEAVLQVNDIYKVNTMIDIPQSLINAYVKKVKDDTGKNLRQFFGDVNIAEEIVKQITKDYLNVDSIPGNALMGGGQEQAQSQVQVQTQGQGQAQMQTQPQAQVQDFGQEEVQPQGQVQMQSQPQGQMQAQPQGQIQAQPQGQGDFEEFEDPQTQGQGQAQSQGQVQMQGQAEIEAQEGLEEVQDDEDEEDELPI